MRRLHDLAAHVTTVLGIMFIVFMILDQFNPMMNFVDNTVSRALLGLLCLSGGTLAICGWKVAEKDGSPSEKEDPAA